MTASTNDFETWLAERLEQLADEAAVPTIQVWEIQSTTRRRHWIHRVAFTGAAALAVVVMFGVIQLAISGGESRPAASANEIEILPGFTVPTTGRSAQVGPMLVFEAAYGPAPLFNPAVLGTEFGLRQIPPHEFVVPTDELGTGDGPALGSDTLISLGEIDGAQIGLHKGGGDLCIYLGNFTTVTGGGECSQSGELVFTINSNAFVDPPIGRFFAMVGIPPATSIVTAELTDGSVLWQRPTGRTAFFLQPEETGIRSIVLLDASGTKLEP